MKRGRQVGREGRQGTRGKEGGRETKPKSTADYAGPLAPQGLKENRTELYFA